MQVWGWWLVGLVVGWVGGCGCVQGKAREVNTRPLAYCLRSFARLASRLGVERPPHSQTRTSMRRLRALFTAVPLLTIGRASPYPWPLS